MINTYDRVKVYYRSVLLTALSLLFFSVSGQVSDEYRSETGKENENSNNATFYDSLKVKAEKSRLGNKLYDLFIIKPENPELSVLTTSSVVTFNDYKGKIIRNIEIRRLNVFGTDINDPSFQDTKGIYKLLNRTHVKTNERIISKYLLFKKGDEISPLVLGDNERVLRQLPFIEDARILIVPVTDNEADVIVVVKDIYSLGVDYSFRSINKGTIKVFDRNILGTGHELEFVIPYDSYYKDSPGFGANYLVNNFARSFTDLRLHYSNGLGIKTYGINLTRDFLSSSTKYAGGITVKKTFTTVDLDTLAVAEPFNYGYQDYWAARSFLINEESVMRIIIGARYTRNNIFTRPVIEPNSYHSLQDYNLFLGSLALSVQKFYKTSLIYNYGRTEDIPYGGLIRLTAGREFNEFKLRTYAGVDVSAGKSFTKAGYFYLNTGYSTYIHENSIEQGVFILRLNHFSNLYKLGRFQIRNFLYINYTQGISRYNDEFLYVNSRTGMAGFSNDSIRGTGRVMLNLESVVFSPVNIYGFRFAFFGFANMAMVDREPVKNSNTFLSGIGLGVRIRNDNLVLQTFQIRLGYFPNPPSYSNLNYLQISGEQVLTPSNFDSGPPEVFRFR